MFDKVNWTNVANTIGAVAIGITVGILIVGTGGIAAPIIGAAMLTASVASAVTARAAALSILPFGIMGSKMTKLAHTELPEKMPNPGDIEELNGKIGLAKFGQGMIDFAAGVASGLSSKISGHWDIRNTCINAKSDM